MAYFLKVFERQMKIWKILIEDWFDPQPNSSIQPKARELLHMEREYIVHHIRRWWFGDWAPHSLEAVEEKYSEDYSKYSTENSKWYKPSVDYLKHLKTSSKVLDACRTRLRRARGLVRPGAAGLLTGVESSRVRDIAWNIPYHIVTTRTEVGLVEYMETTR